MTRARAGEPRSRGWPRARRSAFHAVTAILLCALATPALGDVETSVVKRDYLVGGTTARHVVDFMKFRPLRGDRGNAIASIVPSRRLTLATEQRGRSCRVKRIDLDIDFVLTLPKAAQESEMAGGTRSAWRSFVAFAQRHEEQHRRIYVDCARRFVAQARRLRADSCGALESEIRGLQNREEAACEARHLAFDRRDRRRLTRLRLFRLADR